MRVESYETEMYNRADIYPFDDNNGLIIQVHRAKFNFADESKLPPPAHVSWPPMQAQYLERTTAFAEALFAAVRIARELDGVEAEPEAQQPELIPCWHCGEAREMSELELVQSNDTGARYDFDLKRVLVCKPTGVDMDDEPCANREAEREDKERAIQDAADSFARMLAVRCSVNVRERLGGEAWRTMQALDGQELITYETAVTYLISRNLAERHEGNAAWWRMKTEDK